VTVKLTDEEREALNETAEGEQALRIIDAQAAVIERVRAVCHQGAEKYALNPDVAATYREILADLSGGEALAAAPEHTMRAHCTEHAGWRSDCERCAAPEHTAPDDCDTVHERFSSEAHRQAVAAVDSLRPRLSASNAKVAELERMLDTASDVRIELAGPVVAANARVAELETLLKRCQNEAADTWSVLVRAANARADAAGQLAESFKQTAARHHAEAERAESEAAAMRAEVERLKRHVQAIDDGQPAPIRERLSTATELLRRAIPVMSDQVLREVDDFLSTAPAPTEREAAERKVLEAMRGADLKLLRELLASPDRSRRDIASAEFARREAAQHATPVAPGGDGGGI